MGELQNRCDWGTNQVWEGSFMLLASLSLATIEQDRSSERRALLERLSDVSRIALPEVEVVIHEASPSFNAQAFSVKRQQVVALFGGLAFNRRMGKDGLLFTILHEIGHHLAPGPRITRTNNLSCDCAADRWAIGEGSALFLPHGLTLDINSALNEIEEAISELSGVFDLTARRWCFDWGRRKISLTSSLLDPLMCCEYRVSLDNEGGKDGISDSERR
jgi:hypothetical protein